MKLCPFCEQDIVWRVYLDAAPEHRFQMCFECDSVWLEGQLVSDKAATTFDRHMRSLSRIPDWKDIKKIEKAE